MDFFKFQTNNEDGEFLVRTRRVDNLPESVVKPEDMKSIVDIMLLRRNPINQKEFVVCFFDFDDFKNVFRCTLFELQAQVRSWLELLGRADGQWVRIDILVPEPEATPTPIDEPQEEVK